MIEIPTHVKEEMIQEAKDKALFIHETDVIYPCGKCETFDEAFTFIDELDTVIFWYDVPVETGMTSCVVMRETSAFEVG